ncbi:hypothetical protein [Desulfitobacterium sp.]|nr:hypothetical protein [Desulfitobacterium sp.]HVJ48639.1 hypothetical protein [Desulfitobacterium sp.]
MGAHKKVSRAKSPISVRDPHYTEYDVQKGRDTFPAKHPPKG